MNRRRGVKYVGVLISTFICFNLIYKMDPPQTWSAEGQFQASNFQQRDTLKVIQTSHQDWQPVLGSKQGIAVYTAYSILSKSSPQVLIIGAAKKEVKYKIRCQFYSHQNRTVEEKMLISPGKIETLKVGTKPHYPIAGVFITCPIPKWEGKVFKPEVVSVFFHKDSESGNLLKIQYQDDRKELPYKYNFSVCVKPTFNFNEVLPLLEWIEFYKLMGVEQFTLYNMTIGPEASCILNQFMSGFDPSIKFNVLPWTNHHLLNDSAIRTDWNNVPQYSIAASQNDCIYRHRGRDSKYMIFVDLDEFIMPREKYATNYHDLIDLLNSQKPKKKIGEYLFKNAFFILSRPDDPQLQKQCSIYPKSSLKHTICQRSLLMRKVTMEDYHPYRIRSKYIVRPEGVKQTSNHYVNSFEKGYSSLQVPDKFGISRHYRYFQEGNHTGIDRISSQFGSLLVENLSKRIEHFMKTCNIDFE